MLYEVSLFQSCALSRKLSFKLAWNTVVYTWAGAPNYYLDMLDKQQKWACEAVGPALAASLEPSAHRSNMASLSLIYRYFIEKY